MAEAEKEASEVLHSLLTSDRVEKEEIIIDAGDNHSPSDSFHSSPDGADVEAIQYAPISISHSLFSTIDATNHFSSTIDDQQVVIWEGTTLVDSLDSSMAMYTGHPMVEASEEATDPLQCTEVKSKKTKAASPEKKKVSPKKKKKPVGVVAGGELTKLEESPAQVKERFKRGCECQDESCFRGLNPETVFKHRHNIAELTKGEHDMYLMGVTMACLANPDTTVRHRERRRLRAQYVYQGRRVCLDAFLYLENCTHYQLKRIRKHVMTDGVVPRVHGNHGKKPHNTFSLDIYCHAREFLKQYLEQHTGERDILNTKQPIQLPWDVTRKNLHDAYKEYGQILEPGVKLMGYSTFRHFMKEQFPHVKFCKLEPKSNNHLNSTTQQQPQQQVVPQVVQQIQERPRDQVQKCILNNEVQQVIPLVVATSSDGQQGTQHQQSQAFIVTPVPQLLSNANIVTSQNGTNHNSNTFSYQLTNTGYVINEQGNIVTTMANGQQPYFSRLQ